MLLVVAPLAESHGIWSMRVAEGFGESLHDYYYFYLSLSLSLSLSVQVRMGFPMPPVVSFFAFFCPGS